MFDYLYILDDKGNPVKARSIEVWEVFLFKTDRHVAVDEVLNVMVSTVFLGINCNWTGKGPPILWETMVFGGDLNERQRRYSSKELALQGHAEILALVKLLVCS